MIRAGKYILQYTTLCLSLDVVQEVGSCKKCKGGAGRGEQEV